jgi:hypothetical protein
MIPNPFYQASLARLVNQVAALRPRVLFDGAPGAIAGIPVSNPPTRNRWRFYGHISPMTQSVFATMYFALCDDGTKSAPSGKLELFKASDDSSIGSATFTYGGTSETPDNVPSEFGGGTVGIDVSDHQDEDIYGIFTDVGSGRLISATAFEVPVASDTANGFVAQDYSIGQDILDTDRGDISDLAVSLWKRQGATVLSWSSSLDADAPSTTASTAVNWIDGSSTSPSSSTPGYVLDMRYKTTLSRSSDGVPCVLAVCGKSSGTHGTLKIVDSDGNDVDSIADGWTTSASWQTAAITLPATKDKYDLFISSNGTDTFTLYAVSIFEYLA